MAARSALSALAVRRIAAAAAAVVVIATGLFVHTALPDNLATDVAADALYAVAAYAGIVLLAPRLPSLAAGAIAAAWCVAVEVFQLTGLPELWGSVVPVVMLVLGTVFEARDLMIYVVMSAVVTLVDAIVRARFDGRAVAVSGGRRHPAV